MLQMATMTAAVLLVSCGCAANAEPAAPAQVAAAVAEATGTVGNNFAAPAETSRNSDAAVNVAGPDTTPPTDIAAAAGPAVESSSQSSAIVLRSATEDGNKVSVPRPQRTR